MKKYLALLLIAAMMLTFVACNNGGEEEVTTVGEGEATVEPTGEAATDAPTDPAQPTQAEEPTGAEEPTDAPEQPTDAPEEPTDAPEEPTEPAEQPTDAPEQPTEPEETKPADGIYDLDADKACFAAKSFDECEAWNGETELVKFFTPGQAASLPDIVDIPSESTAVRFWGWIGTTQDIVALGYRIDNAAPVFGEDWFFTPEDGVIGAVNNAGGSYATRFKIFADVSEAAGISAGEHTVTALYKLEDGTKVAICSVKVNVGYRKPILDNTTKSLSADAATQSGDYGSSILADLFTMELPINQCGIADGLFTLAGICDMKAKMDGKYSVTVKDFWSQNAEASYLVVRGTSAIHSEDVPAAETHINIEGSDYNFYPINNYYETDGHPEGNSCGGSGICIAMLDDGTLAITVKYFDAAWPSRVQNARFTYVADSRDVTVVDDNTNVYVYAGNKVLVTIALEGSKAIADYAGLEVPEDVHFAAKATLTGADGSKNVVENTLVLDCAAGEIGITARATTVRFSGVEVGAPFEPTDASADAGFKHVSPDDIRLTAEGTTLTAYAWGWVSVCKEIAGFGYQLDNNLPVWDEVFTVVAEQGVLDAVAATGGTCGSRFRIEGVIENAAYGEHTIKYLVKYTDGTVTAFQTKTAMIARPIISADEEAACKANVSFDELDGWTGGVQGPSAFVPGQSAAWDHIVTIEKNVFDQLRVWGWVGCTQALDMNGFGYTINGSVYRVTDPAFAFETGADVFGASATMGGIEEGTSRFKIFVDIAGLDVGEYTVQTFYTLADGTIVEICAFTVKVTAPIEQPLLVETDAAMFSGFNNCTAENEDGEYGPCMVLLATGGDPYMYCNVNKPEIAGTKVVVLKYRTTGGDNGEFFVGAGAGPHGGTDEVKFTYVNDGEWHTLCIDLTATPDWGEKLNYIRYDFFPDNSGAIRLAYVAYCANMQDAEAYAANN